MIYITKSDHLPSVAPYVFLLFKRCPPPSKVMHWEVNSSSRPNADLPATEVLPNLESLKLTRSSDSDIRASLRPPSRSIPPPTTAERDYSTGRPKKNVLIEQNLNQN